MEETEERKERKKGGKKQKKESITEKMALLCIKPSTSFDEDVCRGRCTMSMVFPLTNSLKVLEVNMFSCLWVD